MTHTQTQPGQQQLGNSATTECIPNGRVAVSSNPQLDESQQQMRKYVLIRLVAVAPFAFSDAATAGGCGFFGYSGYAAPRVYGYG